MDRIKTMKKKTVWRMAMLLMACLLTTAISSISSERLCYSSKDCNNEEQCVAGIAETTVQTCVKGPNVCSGDTPGTCPTSLNGQGQLLCAWIPDPQACGDEAIASYSTSCKLYGDRRGIYKCISPSKCDLVYGRPGGNKAICTAQCMAGNGQVCYGKGSCQSTGPESFQCMCEAGWTGNRCEVYVKKEEREGVNNVPDEENQIPNNGAGKDLNGNSPTDEKNSGDESNKLVKEIDKKRPSPSPEKDGKATETPNKSKSFKSTLIMWILIGAGVLLAVVIPIVAYVYGSVSHQSEDKASDGEVVDPDGDVAYASANLENGTEPTERIFVAGGGGGEEEEWRESSRRLTPRSDITLM